MMNAGGAHWEPLQHENVRIAVQNPYVTNVIFLKAAV